MNTIQKVNTAINALKAGQELENAITWKTVQALSGPLLVILGAIVEFSNIPLTGGQLTSLSIALATIGVIANSYITIATTKTLGLKP
jgi:hypothetical protein